MNIASELLSRLEHVTPTGGGWRARCPAHDGNSCDSLKISETDETVLIKCWGGCEASEVLHAVGMEFADLYPPTIRPDMKPAERRETYRQRRIAHRVSDVKTAADVLALESVVLGIFGRKMQKILLDHNVHLESKLADGDLARFREAQDRIDLVQENLRAIR